MDANEFDQPGDMQDVQELPEFDEVWDDAVMQNAEPAEQCRGLVEWIVKQLAEDPEQVQVSAETRGSMVAIDVRLPESDLGKVIGRGGRIAKSIRTALMIIGSRHHMRASLNIEGIR